MKRLNQLHSVISTRSIARRMLLLSVIKPSLEYGNEICDCNKSQAHALESVILGGTRWDVLLYRTCNEAVRGDMGFVTLRSHRDKAKLKWWCLCLRIDIPNSIVRSGI